MGQAADVVNTDEFEDILNTRRDLHIGHITIAPLYIAIAIDIGSVAEGCARLHILHVTIGIGGAVGIWQVIETKGLIGIIMVSEVAGQSVEGYNLAQFEALESGDTVEDPSFQIIGQMPSDVSVGQELHGLHEVKGLGIKQDTGIGHRHKELGIRNLITCYVTYINDTIQVTEGGEPEAFLG